MKILNLIIIVITLMPSFAFTREKEIVVKTGEEVCTLFKSNSSKRKSSKKDYVLHFELSRRISVNGIASMTTQGNGTLKISNLFLRLYDVHDDGIVFENGCLKLVLEDFNHDGVKDLAVNGVINEMDEKIEGKILRSYPISRQYLYDKKSRNFISNSDKIDKAFEL
jgi:hypothetical protein